MRRFWQSIAGASVLVLALASTLAMRQDEVLRAALTGLLEYATAHPGLAAMLYVVFAASGMLTPFPSALIVMLIGGFLFGPLAGGMLSAAGATLSAGVVYRLGRSLFAGSARKILSKRLLTTEKAMASHPVRYLLMLRLLPIVPAWIANLVPVLFRLPLRTVMFATFVGILPMCVISGSLGSGLRSLDEIGDQVPQVLLSRWYLLALLFSLVLLVFLSSTAGRRNTCEPLDSDRRALRPQSRKTVGVRTLKIRQVLARTWSPASYRRSETQARAFLWLKGDHGRTEETGLGWWRQ